MRESHDLAFSLKTFKVSHGKPKANPMTFVRISRTEVPTQTIWVYHMCEILNGLSRQVLNPCLWRLFEQQSTNSGEIAA
jgi:hypothetical protein